MFFSHTCNSKQSHRRADLSAFQPHCSSSTHNHRRADICSSASPLQFHAQPQEGRGFQAWIFKKTVQQSLFFSLQFPAMGSRWQRFPGLDLLIFFPPCNFQKWPQDGRGFQAWFVYIQFVYTVYTVFFKLLNYYTIFFLFGHPIKHPATCWGGGSSRVLAACNAEQLDLLLIRKTYYY